MPPHGTTPKLGVPQKQKSPYFLRGFPYLGMCPLCVRVSRWDKLAHPHYYSYYSYSETRLLFQLSMKLTMFLAPTGLAE